MTPFSNPRLFAVGACAAALLTIPPAASQAEVVNATFTVTADVLTNCFVEADNLNFGNYTGVEVDANTTVRATCSTGTPYTIGLSAGTSTGAVVTARKMTGPASELLAYSLSQDAAHTVNWGDTIGTDTVAGTGTGVAQPLTVFGRITAGQFLGPGAFTDSIVVTLTF
jgi:spore coat protein U-like protein